MRQQLALAGVESQILTQGHETHSDAFYTPISMIGRMERFYRDDGGLDLDPAWHPDSYVKPRIGYTREQDGLVQPWPERANGWLNPPYSDVTPFLRLVIEHQTEHAGTWLSLLKVDTSTAWWREYVWDGADRVSFLYRRVGFEHVGEGLPGAKWPSAVVLYAEKERGRRRTQQLSRFARIFGAGLGRLWRPD